MVSERQQDVLALVDEYKGEYPSEVVEEAKCLVREDRSRIDGKTADGAASGAMYAACISKGHDVTQAEVAKTFGVSAVTVRNRWSDFRSSVGLS